MNIRIYMYMGTYAYTHRHKYMQTNRISLAFVSVVFGDH